MGSRVEGLGCRPPCCAMSCEVGICCPVEGKCKGQGKVGFVEDLRLFLGEVEGQFLNMESIWA